MGWSYFEIRLIPSPLGSPDSEPQSKLTLSDREDFLNNEQMMDLRDYPVPIVRCVGFDIKINGQAASSSMNTDVVAMIDSGGGVILSSNPAAEGIAKFASNGEPAFSWPSTPSHRGRFPEVG